MAGDRQGIVIRFLSDVVDFVTGKNKVKDELRDLGQGVEGVGDSSEDATRKTVDGLKEVERAAGDAASSTDDLGESTEEAATKGGGLVKGLRDGLLGVAGIAGGVGGIIASVVGKAVDFVTGKIKEQVEAAGEMKAALIEAYAAAGAAGDAYLTKAQIIAEANDIIADSARRAKATQEAATIGVDANTYIRAQAGDYEALIVVIEAAKRAEAERRAEGAGGGSKSEQAAALAEVNAIESIVKKNEDLIAAHKEGQEVAAQTIAISKEIEAAELARIARTTDADQARYQGIADNIAKLQGTSVDVPVKFSIDKKPVEDYLADLKRRRIPIVADVVDRYGRELD